MRSKDNEKSNVVKKNLTRRDFIGKTTAGIATTAVSTGFSSIGLSSCKRGDINDENNGKYSKGGFSQLVEKLFQRKRFMLIIRSFQQNRCIYPEEIWKNNLKKTR